MGELEARDERAAPAKAEGDADGLSCMDETIHTPLDATVASLPYQSGRLTWLARMWEWPIIIWIGRSRGG